MTDWSQNLNGRALTGDVMHLDQSLHFLAPCYCQTGATLTAVSSNQSRAPDDIIDQNKPGYLAFRHLRRPIATDCKFDIPMLLCPNDTVDTFRNL